VLFLFVFALAITIYINVSAATINQHFVELAQSFLQGRLDFIFSSLDRGDVAAFNSRAYWPLGPFPAVVLIPFVLMFGSYVTIGLVALPLIFAAVFLMYRLATTIGFKPESALWLSFGFIFASPFINVVWLPYSWQFAHVVAVVLLSWALAEYFGKKRYWLIGVLCACPSGHRYRLFCTRHSMVP
jgi:hypothetical protein